MDDVSNDKGQKDSASTQDKNEKEKDPGSNEVGEMTAENMDEKSSESQNIVEVVDKIIKPNTEIRQYRGLVLSNSLKVLLISDPDASTAAAALDVHVGELKDPKDIAGLTHFCGRILLAGSEKYPAYGEFLKYLQNHGGSGNARTTLDHSTFFFSVTNDYFKEAFDRFAQFFRKPLFTKSACEKEITAIVSENEKNLMSDAQRMLAVRRKLSKENHDYSKSGFVSGNSLEMLSKEAGLDLHSEVLKFYQDNFSSNIMTLVAIGRESLDNLSRIVVPLMADIENKNVKLTQWTDHPHGPEQVKNWVYVVPEQSGHSIYLIWPIADLRNHYKTKPDVFISHLLEHKGVGGLVVELKSKGWVTELHATAEYEAKSFGFYRLEMVLTDAGAENVEQIVTFVYQYLKMLKKSAVTERTYKEIQVLKSLEFQFEKKEENSAYVSTLARSLQDYPMNNVVSAQYSLQEFNSKLINDFLDKLIPENMSVYILDKTYEGKTDQTEPSSGTEYKTEKINDKTFKKWKKCSNYDKFFIPKPNTLIPENVELVERDGTPKDTPYTIRDTKMTRLWFVQDKTFLIPKAHVSLEIRSPFAYNDPLMANLTALFVMMVNDSLSEYKYEAEVAGMSYNIWSCNSGLQIMISGYSDKQFVLLKILTDKITSFKPDQKNFGVYKEKYEKHLKNFSARKPSEQCLFYTQNLLTDVSWNSEDLLMTVGDINISMLEAFVKQFFGRVSVECFVYGNVTEQVAVEMLDYVETALRNKCGSKAMLPCQLKHFRQINLPNGSSHLYEKQSDVHDTCLDIVFQTGISDPRGNVLVKLLELAISDPLNSTFKTNELGYVCESGIWSSCGVKGLRIFVQSSQTRRQVTDRIDTFLNNMDKTIRNMSDKTFKELVESLSNKLKEKPKDIGSQHNKYWTEIIEREYVFDRENVELKKLKTVTKSDLQNLMKEFIAEEGPSKRRFCTVIRPEVKSNDNQSSSESDSTRTKIAEDEIAECEVSKDKKTSDKEALLDDTDKNKKHPVEEFLRSGRSLVRAMSVLMKVAPKGEKVIIVDDINSFKRRLGLYPCPKANINCSESLENHVHESNSI